MNVPFVDIRGQHKALRGAVERAVKDVFTRGDFILGKDVHLFEQEFAAYCGSRFALGVNSGTDALFLSLIAMGIGPGDEVIVPAFTFVATAFVVSATGARPVFADIDEKTYTIDVERIEQVITRRTRAVIPVHLFGQCADMQPLMRICRKHGLKIIEDACQAHGAEYLCLSGKGRPRKAGSIGDTGAFSFYPTKNLGGAGDGGMIVTDSKKLFDKLYRLRDCGRKTKYEHVVLGYNSRLDTLQAAILRQKLKLLDQWNRRRIANAALYDRCLEQRGLGALKPRRAEFSSHVFHIYAVRLPRRAAALALFKEKQIGCMVNYPIPLHLQKAYAGLGYRAGAFPVSERVCTGIVSLPMHPFLTPEQISFVADTLKEV
ncbi:MAG TPA: DegT/DnrJ/EryC1/StrS family aminotransferase [Candidatus Omnitrophota bacterium]|nr:DegT/DnrJ/EryC1/StrS family aminotransferase [Candidatus Omnitrophota bacterium]HRZ15182.1 DegT/DnrJ/EryC1/StrS family aminotransferase [Candidatus Omnitrophota bacterium]